MTEYNIVVMPPLRITKSRNITTVSRYKLYPYNIYNTMNSYNIEFSAYDDTGELYPLLNDYMMRSIPIFFDFSSKVDNLWGHILLTDVTPSIKYNKWTIDIRGILIPSWGTVISRTSNSGLLIGSNTSDTIYSYTYQLGSTQWSLIPAIDTVNKTITWEFIAYNPLVEVDYEMNLDNVYRVKSGSGSYDWNYESVDSYKYGNYSYKVTRTSGSYTDHAWYDSDDNANYKYIDLSNTPFINTTIGTNGSQVKIILRDDSGNDRYHVYNDNQIVSRTYNFHQTWNWTDSGTAPDFSAINTIIDFANTDIGYIDRIGFTYGRPAIYELRVPEYDNSRLVKIESYYYGDSNWYEVIQYDPTKPDQYSPTSLYNLFYKGGGAAPYVTGVKTFALYRMGTNSELVSPITYEDSKSVDLFPDMQYTNTLGNTIGIGLLLGSDSIDHLWSWIRLRITYPYSDLSMGNDYISI